MTCFLSVSTSSTPTLIWTYLAGHEDAGVVTGHIGTTHPNLYPLAGDDRALTLLKRSCASSGGFGALGVGVSETLPTFDRQLDMRDTPGSWQGTGATGPFREGAARYQCYTQETTEIYHAVSLDQEA